ncbi:MAG: hypothetical protein LBS18_02425, partial [Clostridiales bacterium]|nr:hypothetical protein [Clostridiales bacterium]
IQVKTGLENGKASVTDIVQMVRNAPQTAEYILYKGLVDKNGDVVTIPYANTYEREKRCFVEKFFRGFVWRPMLASSGKPWYNTLRWVVRVMRRVGCPTLSF